MAPERTYRTDEGTNDGQRDDIRDVFEHWQEASGHTAAQLLDGRRQKIRARLRTYSVDQLKRAISAACADPFYQGKNDRGKRFDWIETLLKNDEAVERHLEAHKEARNNGGDPLMMTAEEVEEWDR